MEQGIHTTERRKSYSREELVIEYWYFSEGGPLCTKLASLHSILYSVLRSVAIQNLLCWLSCFVYSGPPSPKFQILPSQLRQPADRAAGLCIKSLGYTLILCWICTWRIVWLKPVTSPYENSSSLFTGMMLYEKPGWQKSWRKGTGWGTVAHILM
jgi:hypothetical protein